jgi:hypothetical protein
VAKFPVSYSRLNTYESCPAKFEALHVLKTAKDEGNQYSEYGDRVHKGLESYGKTRQATGISAEVAPYTRYVDLIMAQPGEKHFEYQMALTEELKPCSWMAPDVWLRAIADVLVINGDTAQIVDWKTGKVRHDPIQMQWFACMVLYLFPQVQTVKTVFVWLAHGQVTPGSLRRGDEQHLWPKIVKRLDALQQSVDLGVFPTNPTYLCRWCPNRTRCPDARL